MEAGESVEAEWAWTGVEAAAAASKQARSRREESGGIDERQACVCVRVTARVGSRVQGRGRE